MADHPDKPDHPDTRTVVLTLRSDDGAGTVTFTANPQGHVKVTFTADKPPEPEPA